MTFFALHSLGIFNAWILMFLFALPILFTIINHPHIFSSTSGRIAKDKNSSEFRKFIAVKFFMLFYFIYSIFIPIQIRSVLFIPGLIVYISGFVFYISAWSVINKTGPGYLFKKGPFRLSRHPVYISSFIMFTGAGILSSSVFFLILSSLVGISHLQNSFQEEKTCLDIFGDDYREYISKTHRWIGLPRK